MPYTVQRYQDKTGKAPYTDWIKKLRKKDIRAAGKIDVQVSRASAGNFGDHKFERNGVWVLRINYGPGYRVYYSVENGKIILLLVGGDKASQQTDINNAIDYLNDYHTRIKDDQ
ncbi:addiction module killer protein [Salmonella enterica]|uniref:Addiction module killer protein n=1 Tax=Salmonella enterica subsp. enterica serovar Panama TaxID=29472 RepID=A0A5U8J5B8_SALET|nr:type II toxin-antitoxin system RelE/ParE family toxin [Salmonella enterica]EBR7992650.1 addiction module killer protein [Salmonella enterica subsp. enterica serovar Panama]ECI3668984.1 addiction module killer protein [Salmonella enterica subsp. diarizonae]ASD89268.1 addiction module killer protein [Salmonella enterica subsp. enterica serovar India str. SA20085604]EAV3945278.1 addiction module killer protein [Salmonella enterica]EBR8433313.1 addiction module killer protein [Salmonella enteri